MDKDYTEYTEAKGRTGGSSQSLASHAVLILLVYCEGSLPVYPSLTVVCQGPIQKVDPASGVSVRRPTDLVCQSLKQCARERDKQEKQGTGGSAS